MKILTTFVGLTILLSSQLSLANRLILSDFPESGLLGSGNVLDNEFDRGDRQYIDDDRDQHWFEDAETSATNIAKRAGFSRGFGFIDDDENFASSSYVPYMKSQAILPSNNIKALFRYIQSDNVFCGWFSCADHEAHRVNGLFSYSRHDHGDDHDDWEDRKHSGDHDKKSYMHDSDMTVVPVPAALWLFGSGLLSLLTLARRRA